MFYFHSLDMLNVHVLDVQPIVQKFFKPLCEDFILFLDDGVTCPRNDNPFATDKGHVSVSTTCFDCKSFKGFFQPDDGSKRMFCEGSFELVVNISPSVRDFLEPVEQAPELFWKQ